jgi:hypothetical protein
MMAADEVDAGDIDDDDDNDGGISTDSGGSTVAEFENASIFDDKFFECAAAAAAISINGYY